MILGYITGGLVIIILALRFLPFIPIEVKIEWITYFGLALMFFTGGMAFAFIKNIFIAIFMGALALAFFQALIKTLPQMLGV